MKNISAGGTWIGKNLEKGRFNPNFIIAVIHQSNY
jgi:hypothetical protein